MSSRLSRRTSAIAAAIALAVVSAAVLWALQSNRTGNKATDELLNTDHRTLADGLSELPRDYAAIPHDVPRLGPPLPGDLAPHRRSQITRWISLPSTPNSSG